MFGHRIAHYDALSRVFASTGIERRYSAVPLEWFEEPHDWPDRTAAYIAAGSNLFEEVVRKALAAGSAFDPTCAEFRSLDWAVLPA
jgi:alkylresorcinol/alkylpyrone synthase